MKIICAPDSFKESLSAVAAVSAMADGIHSVLPEATVDCCPVGDGGEGTLAALLESGSGQLVETTVAGPVGELIESSFGLLDNGRIAFVESATAIGLVLIPAAERNVMKASSYGVGEMLLSALETGPAEIVVGVGGSATNDGGCGLAQALGVKFFDRRDKLIENPIGGEMLNRISRIDATHRNKLLDSATIVVACDVNNPLTGQNGAAHIYAPQKGANKAEVRQLDSGLLNLAMLVRRDLGVDIEHIEGAGAGGGLGGGLIAFAAASIESGIDTVLEAVGFKDRVKDCQLCLTGEGRLDGQSLSGKACIGVARAAGKQGVPTIALVGSVGSGVEKTLAAGLDDYIVIGDGVTNEESMQRAATLVFEAAARVVRKHL